MICMATYERGHISTGGVEFHEKMAAAWCRDISHFLHMRDIDCVRSSGLEKGLEVATKQCWVGLRLGTSEVVTHV